MASQKIFVIAARTVSILTNRKHIKLGGGMDFISWNSVISLALKLGVL